MKVTVFTGSDGPKVSIEADIREGSRDTPASIAKLYRDMCISIIEEVGREEEHEDNHL